MTPPLVPRPGTPGNTLVADGGFFLEMTPDGTPLGTWHWDDDLMDWVFEETPLSSVRINPKTGDNATVSATAALAALLGAAMIGAMVCRRKFAK